MDMLRSILFLLFLLGYTPPYAIACLIAFPFLSTDGRYRMVQGWTGAVIWVARALCGLRYRFIGMENAEAMRDKPVIVLSKHQSAWETIAFVSYMPKPLCYVFKRELLYVPFFGWALGLLRMVHINRADGKNAYASVVFQGKERLSEGAWIIFFPEGTRTRTGTQGKYKTGGSRLAVDTDAWVLPVAHNAGRCWPRNRLRKTPGLITVSIGPAISSAGRTPDSLMDEVETWIEREMRTIDPDAYSATNTDKTTASIQ